MSGTGNNIYIVGLTGSGKSTVGKELADLMSRTFIDLDEIIEEREGMDIPAMFRERGEAFFRRAEKTALADISKGSGQVVACGGGTAAIPGCMDTMRNSGLTVFLNVPPEICAKRAGNGKRPLLEGLSENERTETTAELLRKRSPFYSRAHVEITPTSQNSRRTAETIITAISNYR